MKNYVGSIVDTRLKTESPLRRILKSLLGKLGKSQEDNEEELVKHISLQNGRWCTVSLSNVEIFWQP